MKYIETGYYNISIHAPARGATLKALTDASIEAISIHAPARGATSIGEVWAAPAKFQSTPLREGRLVSLAEYIKQSIFQSTPLREGRLMFLCATFRQFSFQSTPLREGRPHIP